MKSTSKILFVFVAAFLFLTQKVESALPRWVEEFAKYWRYSLEYFTEYNDNIFLTPSGLEEDVIQAVRQEIELEIPGEKTFFFARFANTLPYYWEEDELVPSYDIETLFSFRPTDKLSLGVSNQFFKIDDSEVGTSLGDLVLSLGYWANTVRTEAKYELFNNTDLAVAWAFDRFDYDEEEFALFIDRDVHDIDARLIHSLSSIFDVYGGYRFRDVAFDDLDNKDSESHILFTGAKWKWNGVLNLFSEIGYEEREFQNNTDVVTGTSVAGSARRHHDNFNYRIGLETNFSRFHTFSLYYDDRLYESSRSEFTNYQGKTVGLSLRSFLTKKTILFFDFLAQRQDFNGKDLIVSLFGSSGADTDVFRYAATLRRILTPWLHCDIGYVFTKRNTDFVDEDSDNHQIRIGFKIIF